MKLQPPFSQKIDLRQFLLDLREQNHHIYALLSVMPKSAFRILADDELRKSSEMLTIGEFFASTELFHPRQSFFSIHYRTYLYRGEWDVCCPGWREFEHGFCGIEWARCDTPDQLENIVDEFEGVLAYWMREMFLAGTPFLLDLEECGTYGLSPADARALHHLVIDCDNRIVSEFSEDCRTLEELLQIHTERNTPQPTPEERALYRC